MLKQTRSQAGAALAVITLMLGFFSSAAVSAELSDFESTWNLYLSGQIQIGEETQPLADFPGFLTIERTGVTAGGTLTVVGEEAEAEIAIEGATLEDGRLKIQINFSSVSGDSSFDSVMKPIFGELGIDSSKGIQMVGSLEVEGDELSGRLESQDFSQPGVVDSLIIEIFGTREPEEEMAPQLAVFSSGSSEEGDATLSDEEEVVEAEGDILPDLNKIDLGPRPEEDDLHAGSQADVSALEADDLADEEAAVQLSAARAIAEQERKRRELAEASRKLDRVHTHRFEMIGESLESVVADASVRALMTTAARLYYGNYVLLGRDLLEPYLRANGEKFVIHAKVLDQRAVEGGQRRVNVEIAVDTEGLYNDLDSKHFIAEPNFRPVVVVALDESLNDTPNSVPLARVTLQELLKRADMRVDSQVLGQQLDSMDLSSDPALLRQGRLEAQRLNADLLVTGVTRLYGPESRVILYDQFYEVAGSLSLKFIRTDNGEVLRTYEGTFVAKAPIPEDAIEQCFIKLAANALTEMTEGFLVEWQNTMLDKTEYRFCITGTDPKTVDVLGNELRALSGDAELYLKSYFSDVAVLNANLPGVAPEDVEKFLRHHRAPQFKLIPTDRGHYELRVL